MTLEELLIKFEESDKFKLINYESVDEFLNNADDFSYLIIRPDKCDEFQLVVNKIGLDYTIQTVINNEDADEMNYKLAVKNEKQLQAFMNMTINGLEQFSQYKKYAKYLAEML